MDRATRDGRGVLRREHLGVTLPAMGSTTIAIDVDESLCEALARAAAIAGQSLSAYVTSAAADRLLRDEGAGYADVLARHPEFASEVAAARQAALRRAADARAQVLAKYAGGELRRRNAVAAVAAS
jgi:hypothetical protein